MNLKRIIVISRRYFVYFCEHCYCRRSDRNRNHCPLFSGMTARTFKKISSIQEVGCWGEPLDSNTDLLSLRLFKVLDNTVLAYLNPLKNECKTFEEFTSCFIDSANTRSSRLSILVPDLEENESRQYGCTATSVGSLGHTYTVDWFLTVTRPIGIFLVNSKYLFYYFITG